MSWGKASTTVGLQTGSDKNHIFSYSFVAADILSPS